MNRLVARSFTKYVTVAPADPRKCSSPSFSRCKRGERAEFNGVCRKGLARFLEQTCNYEKFAGRFVVVANQPEETRAAFVSVGIVFWTNMVTELS